MWQPIETAPKDGTSILISEEGHPYVMQASWEPWDYAHDQSDCYWRCGRQGAKGYDDSGSMDPTHWMPLPQPPSPSQEKNND